MTKDNLGLQELLKEEDLLDKPYLIHQHKGESKVIRLDKSEITIGRAETADVCIPLKSVSRIHVRLTENWAGFVLKDQDSANGTFINNKPVTEEYQLADGDEIRLGQKTAEDPVLLVFKHPLQKQKSTQAGESSDDIPAPKEDLLEEVSEISAPIAADTPLSGLRKGSLLPKIAVAGCVLALAVISYLIYSLVFVSSAKGITIEKILPAAQHPGAFVKLLGKGFIADKGQYRILFDNKEAVIQEINPRYVIIQLPMGLSAGLTEPVVTVQGHAVACPRMAILSAPMITKVSKSEVYPGDELRIQGQNFAVTSAENTVRVGEVAAEIISATDKEIVIRIPADAIEAGQQQATKEIQVSSNRLDSGVTEITLKKRPISYVSPGSFHAEKTEVKGLEQEAVIVKNVYMSLVLLADPMDGDALSRGQETARTLNTWLQALKTQPVITLDRQDGVTALMAADRQAPLLRITDKDVEAYNLFQPGTYVSRNKLALWLRAVLLDYASVFILNQEPRHTVRVAKGGRVLRYIYQTFGKEQTPFKGIAENDILTLNQEYRQYMAQLGLRIPGEYGDITGTYTGQVDDDFLSSRIANMTPYLELTIKQNNKGRYYGSGRVSLVYRQEKESSQSGFSQEMKLQRGTFQISGVKVMEPEVLFYVSYKGERIKFSGQLDENSNVSGIFSRPNNRRGRFTLIRK